MDLKINGIQELKLEQTLSIDGGNAPNSSTVLSHTVGLAFAIYSFVGGIAEGFIGGAEDAAEAQK